MKSWWRQTVRLYIAYEVIADEYIYSQVIVSETSKNEDLMLLTIPPMGIGWDIQVSEIIGTLSPKDFSC